MNFPRPQIHRSTYADALEAGCDTVMLRHDGFPVSINCVGDEAVIFSEFHFGYPKVERLDVVKIEPFNALFVGAKDRFSERVFVYDIWWRDGQALKDFSYRNRYAILRTVAPQLDKRFVPVTPYPVAAAHNLWAQVVSDPTAYKGLVFRRSKDSSAGDLYLVPYYPEHPASLEDAKFP